jgi:hypothetical protein
VDRVIDGEEPVQMTFRPQLGGGEAPCSIPEVATELGVAEEELDPLRETRGIARIAHEAAARFHEFRQAAQATDEDRPTRRQCLEDRERGVLVAERWHDEEATSRDGPLRVARVDVTRESNASQTEASGEREKASAERTVADDPERGVAGERQRLQQDMKALLFGESPEIDAVVPDARRARCDRRDEVADRGDPAPGDPPRDELFGHERAWSDESGDPAFELEQEAVHPQDPSVCTGLPTARETPMEHGIDVVPTLASSARSALGEHEAVRTTQS